jgi:hypothetical protein
VLGGSRRGQPDHLESGGGEERAGLVVEGSAGGLEMEAGGVEVAG